MGSENKIAHEILPIILKDRKHNQWYVEPFVGGANIIDKVDGNRIGNDNNFFLIEMWKSLQKGWLPPILITEDMYNDIKNNKEQYDPALVGYTGFLLSFGAKWFGGYRRDVAGLKGDMNNMIVQSRRAYDSILKQTPAIQNIIFTNSDYYKMTIPNNSIIYCDPPYQNTTKYKDKFNHDIFWNWIRGLSKKGHKIFISEYNAPPDFKCIWQKDVNITLSKQDGIVNREKLFIPL
jgi:DNA adenine methylase